MGRAWKDDPKPALRWPGAGGRLGRAGPLPGATDRRRREAAGLLQAAGDTEPGELIPGSGGALRRAIAPKAAGHLTWAEENSSGRRRNLSYEEEEAFWAFAAIEVLRLTGIRNEELLELNDHTVTQYRLPSTGEVVPLLQIAPSKTDTERLLLVSPELADILSAIISRLRGPGRRATSCVGTGRRHLRVQPSGPAGCRYSQTTPSATPLTDDCWPRTAVLGMAARPCGHTGPGMPAGSLAGPVVALLPLGLR